MPESNQHRLAKRMRWAARIIGLLAAGLCLLMLTASTIAEVIAGNWGAISQTDIIEGSLIGVLGAIDWLVALYLGGESDLPAYY